jgi:DNA repair exonuclease SbcCD ATPase subunit
VGPENPDVLREVQELQAKKTEVQAKVAALRAHDQDLVNLALEYERRAREFSAFHEEAKRRLGLAGATQAETTSLQPRFGADPQALISRLRSVIGKEVDALVGSGTPPPDGTVAHFQLRIDELQKGIKADVVRKQKLAETTKTIGVKKAEAAKVEREINEADENAKLIPNLLQRRFDAYLEVFDNLQKKKEALSALYAPLRAHLEEHGATGERDLEFFVRTRVRLAKWAAEGQALLDGRKCDKSVEVLAKVHLLQPWISGDPERISMGIRALYDEFKDVRGQIKTGVTAQSFGEWMFSADHILLQYGIRFDGTDLDHLSPGAKGVALLLLYLSIDTNDERPLIIDQPEENLDPKSVYEILVPHIKAARRRRQVIIVTHNPNLVVNTDADQVIVADSVRRERGRLPEISYACGALEDEQVRRKVCEILEGGAEAFRHREAKYRLEEDDSDVL